MNRHFLDLYFFEDKLGKAVIYAAGAQKHSEQVNKHRDKSMSLTEVNKDYRFDRYTYTGAHNYSEPRYTKQSLNNCRKDKASKSKIQKRS